MAQDGKTAIEMTALLDGASQDSKGTVEIIGSEFSKNGAPWHMVLAFSIPDPDEKNKAKFEEKMPDPKSLWPKIFAGHNGTGKMPSSITDGMTRKQFSDAVFNEIVHILGSDVNGLALEEMRSIDGDELFLKIGLLDPKAKADLADTEEFTVMLTEDLYKKQGQQIPTDIKRFEGQTGIFHAHEVKELDGEAVSVTFPAYHKFTSTHAERFQQVGELDCIRLVRRRISKFIHVDALIQAEIATQMFPVHHWDEGVSKLYRKGWNNLWKVFQWPSDERSDLPNAYFGPELGFFFHWYGFMTRYLVFPAVLSIATFTLRVGQLVDRKILNYCSMGFALFLVIWSSIFVGHYKQAKHLKQMKWGMEHMTAATLVVRKQFSDAYRDSVRDYLQHIFHWCMVVFMVVETLVVVAWTSDMQMQAAKNPEGTTYGISNVNLVTYPKYIITVNIKLVDKV